LRLAPGAPRSSPSLARSLLHRSLATARGAKSLGCASLQGRRDPRRRSLAHYCTARSRRLGAPSRSAAPRSRGAAILAVARSLIVAPLARDGSGRQVARLRLAPGAPRSSPSLARSWSHLARIAQEPSRDLTHLSEIRRPRWGNPAKGRARPPGIRFVRTRRMRVAAVAACRWLAGWPAHPRRRAGPP